MSALLNKNTAVSKILKYAKLSLLCARSSIQEHVHHVSDLDRPTGRAFFVAVCHMYSYLCMHES